MTNKNKVEQRLSQLRKKVMSSRVNVSQYTRKQNGKEVKVSDHTRAKSEQQIRQEKAAEMLKGKVQANNSNSTKPYKVFTWNEYEQYDPKAACQSFDNYDDAKKYIKKLGKAVKNDYVIRQMDEPKTREQAFEDWLNNQKDPELKQIFDEVKAIENAPPKNKNLKEMSLEDWYENEYLPELAKGYELNLLDDSDDRIGTKYQDEANSISNNQNPFQWDL